MRDRHANAACAILLTAGAPDVLLFSPRTRRASGPLGSRVVRRTTGVSGVPGGRLKNRVRSGFPDSRLSGFGSVIINDAVKQEFGIEPEERFDGEGYSHPSANEPRLGHQDGAALDLDQ
jgi:hypothetical protein